MLLQPVARNGTSEAKVGDFVVFTWEGHFWKLQQKISENTQLCHLNLSFTLDSYQLVSARLHHKLLWSTIWDANIAKGWPNLQTACLFQSFCCNSFSDKDCGQIDCAAISAQLAGVEPNPVRFQVQTPESTSKTVQLLWFRHALSLSWWGAVRWFIPFIQGWRWNCHQGDWWGLGHSSVFQSWGVLGLHISVLGQSFKIVRVLEGCEKVAYVSYTFPCGTWSTKSFLPELRVTLVRCISNRLQVELSYDEDELGFNVNPNCTEILSHGNATIVSILSI